MKANKTNGNGAARAHLMRVGAVDAGTQAVNKHKLVHSGIGIPNSGRKSNKQKGSK